MFKVCFISFKVISKSSYAILFPDISIKVSRYLYKGFHISFANHWQQRLDLPTNVVHVHHEIGIKVKWPFPLNTSNHTNQVLKPNHQVKDGATLSIYFPRPKLQTHLYLTCLLHQHTTQSLLATHLYLTCLLYQHTTQSLLTYQYWFSKLSFPPQKYIF